MQRPGFPARGTAPLKLQPDRLDVPAISGYGFGWVSVGSERIGHSLVLGSQGERFDWNCAGFDDLGPAHFERLATLDTELVIFGSGERLRFVPPAWLAPLMARRICVPSTTMMSPSPSSISMSPGGCSTARTNIC